MLRVLKRHFSLRLKVPHCPDQIMTIRELRTHLYGHLFTSKQPSAKLITVIQDLHATKRQDEFIQEMSWLKLEPKDVVRQSQYLAEYGEIQRQLVQAGRAYPCFCSEDRLNQLKRNGDIYDRKCQGVPINEAVRLIQKGKPYRVRFLNSSNVKLQDTVFGDLKQTKEQPEDFVMREAGKAPSAYFAGLADNIHLNVTHYLNEISNVKKAWDLISVCDALNIASPVMMHLPKIIGNQRAEWAEVRKLREKDLLPQAILNSVVLLGWQPFGDGVLSKIEDNDKKFTMQQLVAYFDMDKVVKNNVPWRKKALLYFNKRFMKDVLGDMKLFTDKIKNALPNIRFDNLKLIDANNIVKTSKIEGWHQLKQFSFLFEKPDLSSQKFKKEYEKAFGEKQRGGAPEQDKAQESDAMTILRNLLLICHHVLRDNNFKGEELAKNISKFLMDSRIANQKVYGVLRLGVMGESSTKHNIDILRVCQVLGRVEVIERLKALF